MMLVFVYLLATVLFLALLLSLGVQPKLITRLTGIILFVTGVLGTALYGYAYSVLFPSVPQAVIRTLFSVFCMFLGRNEIGAISAVPALQTPGMQLLIYAVHLMALYTTVGYGDTFPVTVPGRIIGVVFQLCSLGLLALAVGAFLALVRGQADAPAEALAWQGPELVRLFSQHTRRKDLSRGPACARAWRADRLRCRR